MDNYPNLRKLYEQMVLCLWSLFGFLILLMMPALVLAGLMVGGFVGYVLIGFFYLGGMVGMYLHLLLSPLMKWLGLSQKTRDRVGFGIKCITCPLGAITMIAWIGH